MIRKIIQPVPGPLINPVKVQDGPSAVLLASSLATKDNWPAGGGAVSINLSEVFYDETGGIRAASNGAEWHRTLAPGLEFVGGAEYHVSFIFRFGPSGKVRSMMFNTGAGNPSCRIFATAAGVTSVSENNGSIRDAAIVDLGNGFHQINGVFSPDVTQANMKMGIGPSSAVSGEYVDAFYYQISTGGFFEGPQ